MNLPGEKQKEIVNVLHLQGENKLSPYKSFQYASSFEPLKLKLQTEVAREGAAVRGCSCHVMSCHAMSRHAHVTHRSLAGAALDHREEPVVGPVVLLILVQIFNVVQQQVQILNQVVVRRRAVLEESPRVTACLHVRRKHKHKPRANRDDASTNTSARSFFPVHAWLMLALVLASYV